MLEQVSITTECRLQGECVRDVAPMLELTYGKLLHLRTQRAVVRLQHDEIRLEFRTL